MTRSTVAALIAAVAALGLGTPSSKAGPCTEAIAQFEQAVRQSARNPSAGPMARQSVGAQLSRQPTPGSIERAEQQARSTFDETLERAKRLDAQDDRAGCTSALTEAKDMYNLQ